MTVKDTIEFLEKKYNHDEEYLSVIEELTPALEMLECQYPSLSQQNIFQVILEPERIVQFSVPWFDDHNELQINQGFRVQFSSLLGPYKGGLRFQPKVDLPLFKALALEQSVKNALTGLPLGGAKGGADFDPKGKSDAEIKRFCEAFITQSLNLWGVEEDIPAGDMGVRTDEIGYMVNAYRRLREDSHPGAFTGKDISLGGSPLRQEATGYGICYFIQEALARDNEDIVNKQVIISGYGNVAWGLIKKMDACGASVLTLSGRDGYIYDKDGIRGKEKIDFVQDMRRHHRGVKSYAQRFHVPYFPGEKPWREKGDLYIPCATQREIALSDAILISENRNEGSSIFEGSNMSCTNEALNYFQKKQIPLYPSKAVNAGGVSVSFLEMCQNIEGKQWQPEIVDDKLKTIMKNIFSKMQKIYKTFNLGNMVDAANIYGLLRLATAASDLLYKKEG